MYHFCIPVVYGRDICVNCVIRHTSLKVTLLYIRDRRIHALFFALLNITFIEVGFYVGKAKGNP